MNIQEWIAMELAKRKSYRSCERHQSSQISSKARIKMKLRSASEGLTHKGKALIDVLGVFGINKKRGEK